MTRSDIRNRLDRMEKRLGEVKEPRHLMLQRLLRQYGYAAVAKVLDKTGSEFPLILDVFDDQNGPDAFEGYRGLVPDEVIQAAYGRRVNYGGGPKEGAVSTIRLRAGVISEDGTIAPGYRLLGTGAIVTA